MKEYEFIKEIKCSSCGKRVQGSASSRLHPTAIQYFVCLCGYKTRMEATKIINKY